MTEMLMRRGFARLFVIAFLCMFSTLAASSAHAETRKLKLYFLHTGERAEITFKKNGRYIQGGLKKINRFLRDWRRNEPTKMDPRLLDLIWEVYKETGSRKHIHVISGYRSPKTNSLLRKRGRGVARKSQHTLGRALDFFIPGVSLRKLRNIGLKKGLGGVGYYPKSGSPFVHMDTGRVRHWPRMSRKELVRVFPKGKTLHVPTDGKPLAKYNLAKAEYERKLKGKNRIRVAKAEEIRKKPNFFAKLLGRGEGEEEGATGIVSAPKPVKTNKPAAKPTPAAKPVETVKPAAPAPKPPEPLVVEPEPTPETVLAALSPSAIPVPVVAPRVIAQPVVEEPAPQEVQEVTPETPAEEIVEDSNIAIASIIPTRRPVAAVEEPIVVAEATPEVTQVAEATTTTQAGSSDTFSASEIEDLRKQVYSAIRAERESIPARPIPAAPVPSKPLDEGRIVVAAVAPSVEQSGNALAIIPQPRPQSATALAIAKQLQPSEPTEAEVEIAATTSLEPIEPGATTANGTAIPAPNPNAQRDETLNDVQEITTAGIAVPAKAQRPALVKPAELANGKIVIAKKTRKGALTLEQFKSANLDDRLVGKWALAADTSISQIAEINPPAYGKNVIRELPETVLSRGFSRQSQIGTGNGFTGSSIEFLDFTRFN